MPIKVLLQTTIVTPPGGDDWGIARFGRLAGFLRAQTDAGGAPLFDVTARDRAPPPDPDPVLSTLDTSDYDEAWLFAVDIGDGLTADDCAAVCRFRRGGRGLLVTRDHMDLGSSVCSLGGVGKAHFFHSKNVDPDASRRRIDDTASTNILWPNYHSGANGDFQSVTVVEPRHAVLAGVDFLPAHPHEGAVGAPPDEAAARVIATGVSRVSGTTFNLAVAFDPSADGGPAIAQSTFHHFADYNWDPRVPARRALSMSRRGGRCSTTPPAWRRRSATSSTSRCGWPGELPLSLPSRGRLGGGEVAAAAAALPPRTAAAPRLSPLPLTGRGRQPNRVGA